MTAADAIAMGVDLAAMPFDSVKADGAASHDIRRKRRPVIGIVPSQDIVQGRSSISERYANAVVAAGGAPLLFPITQDLGVYETLFPLVDGFILSGGADIDPKRYGVNTLNEHMSEFTPIREELEYLILSYAYEFDVPLLGVCRGSQMINVFYGGTLYLDLPDQFHGSPRAFQDGLCAHWQKQEYSEPTHEVELVPDTQLGRILGVKRTWVNSMHHQGIREVGPALTASAYSADGLVEAIEDKSRTMILGIQWHPEFLTETNPIMCKLFEAFTTQALISDASSKLSKLSISQKRWATYSWPVSNFSAF